jgi:DNA polymerase gamma 1
MKRDDAKIFTYGRIYGAGVKYAAALLGRFNPKLSGKEADERAKDLYAKTKGQRRRERDGGVYWGGSESFMFNQLEAIGCSKGTAATPILGCRISAALTTSNVGSDVPFSASLTTALVYDVPG